MSPFKETSNGNDTPFEWPNELLNLADPRLRKRRSYTSRAMKIEEVNDVEEDDVSYNGKRKGKEIVCQKFLDIIDRNRSIMDVVDISSDGSKIRTQNVDDVSSNGKSLSDIGKLLFSVNEFGSQLKKRNTQTIPNVVQITDVTKVNGEGAVECVDCILKTTNPGDPGFPFLVAGSSKFTVLYNVVARRFSYIPKNICIHFQGNKVHPNKRIDRVIDYPKATLTIHGEEPSMNLDSRYLQLNMSNIGNFRNCIKFCVSANGTMQEFYEAWGRKIGRAIGTFSLGAHGYYMPPTGFISANMLRNEDYVYTMYHLP